MSFIDEQLDSYLMQDALGYNDENEQSYYDDRFLQAQRQAPCTPGGVDWRYEKGGVFYNE